MPATRTAVWLAGLIAPAAAVAQETSPPPFDCQAGFEVLQETALSMPGASIIDDGGFKVVKVEPAGSAWRVWIYFTTRWHPAYPAAAQRTFRKQVTGVWTAESKSCGYGDQAQFATLVSDMKAGDKQLTDASRQEVERQKSSRSPLAPPQ
jgi:hypothetical protein